MPVGAGILVCGGACAGYDGAACGGDIEPVGMGADGTAPGCGGGGPSLVAVEDVCVGSVLLIWATPLGIGMTAAAPGAGMSDVIELLSAVLVAGVDTGMVLPSALSSACAVAGLTPPGLAAAIGLGSGGILDSATRSRVVDL